ncbi:asparagine-linked glycosylation protein [Rhizophlyctis rosea]|uniref:GDP-Man:Man(3)GlcNAc(2)-PP-Dol alpha-1,2-mannosyltransferase n=1 Tax=Rhizophlyctis rosea TaxID=64517 RepID=A0AAD5X649_9FUNG|nr:asparagine-linked glycosylation protein [Rhizophlyctis rosea]
MPSLPQLAAYVFYVVAALGALFLGVREYWYNVVADKRTAHRKSFRLVREDILIGFFHPYCDAGGGGERVLWTAIRAIQADRPRAYCLIYSWDKVQSKTELLAKVKAQFNITVDAERVILVTLTSWTHLEASRKATLILQSLGSVRVAWEALNLAVPDVFIDTTGFAFTYPLVKYFFRVKLVAYVHYPTISTEMLNKVEKRLADFNNTSEIAGSPVRSGTKLWYYRVFTMLYGLVGKAANVVMVNSTWTMGHINGTWGTSAKTELIYPPCDTKSLQSLQLENREKLVISLGQFRPEKNHAAQIEAFKLLIDRHASELKDVRLAVIGSTRNDEDRARVTKLQGLIDKAGLKDKVTIVENAPYDTVLSYLKRASIGLHTMADEHFGISIIEFMAAGVIPVAHNSAGPKLDIITPFKGEQPGFLASTPEEYADALYKALTLPSAQATRIRTNARESVSDRFSDEAFQTQFVAAIQPLLPKRQRA